MSIENQDQKEQIEQTNTETFKKEFSDNFQNLTPEEQKDFEEMVKNTSYDDSLSKENNIQLAFQSSMQDKIDKSFANMKDTIEYREVQDLMREASHKWNVEDIVRLYSEAKKVIDTREGGSAKGTEIHQRLDQESQKQVQIENKNQQEFFDKLWKLREASFQKFETEQKERVKQKEANNQEQSKDNSHELRELTASLNAPPSRTASGNTANSV